MKKPMRLGDLLIESKLITESQLNSALEIQKQSGGKKVGDILVDLDIVSEEQMAEVLKRHFNIEFVKLNDVRISEALLEFIPEEIAREKIIFPYKLRGNTLYIATADPLEFETLNQVGAASGKTIEAVIATRSDIKLAIDKFYNKHKIDSITNTLNASAFGVDNGQISNIDFDEIESRVGEVPVVKFINNLIIQAQGKRSSDIHIEPTANNVRVRFRIDGELVEIVKMNPKSHPSIVTRIKIMAGMDIAEKRIPLDGRFSVAIGDNDVSIRAASMPTLYGEKIVLRLMADTKSGIVPLESLGINEEYSKLIRSMIKAPNGLILVTGPTGSGKSTTLYSILNELSEVNINVLTVEDPIEKAVPGVNQTQVNPKSGLTFATGLRAILRQDPDKIMIGEIRDTETADIAARAAITGHLVLASMHTNSAAAAYMRLIDMEVEPYIVASSLICVIAQRLIKLICPNCKKSYTPTDEDLIYLENLGLTQIPILYKGIGCEHCDYTGNYERTAVMEIIITDSVIRSMIAKKSNATDIEDYLTKHKNQQYLLYDALQLLYDGRINIKELLQLS